MTMYLQRVEQIRLPCWVILSKSKGGVSLSSWVLLSSRNSGASDMQYDHAGEGVSGYGYAGEADDDLPECVYARFNIGWESVCRECNDSPDTVPKWILLPHSYRSVYLPWRVFLQAREY
jgi:hypothetical protein